MVGRYLQKYFYHRKIVVLLVNIIFISRFLIVRGAIGTSNSVGIIFIMVYNLI